MFVYYVNVVDDIYQWFLDWKKAEELATEMCTFVRIYDVENKTYKDKFLTKY